MNDTQAQSMFEEHDEEMKHYLGILIEDSNDKFKLLAEMFGGMNETLTLVAEDVDELKTRMTGLEDRMGGVEKHMGGIEVRMDGLETRIGGVETRIGGLEQKIDSIATDVSDIKIQIGSKVDTISHLALEHRVSVLERSE